MKIFFTVLLIASCSVFAQTVSPLGQNMPVQISPSSPNPASNIRPLATTNTSPQAVAQTEPQKPVNIYEKYFPEINSVTDKIGVGFWEKYWHWILTATVLSFAVLVFVFKRKKEVVVTPYEAAVARLAAAERDAANIEAKEYGRRVSQAVRDYIESARNLPAPERTTEEFLRIAADSKIFDDIQNSRLEKILKLADMAKFAQRSFMGEEKSEILSNARKFVETDNAPAETSGKTDDKNATSSGKSENVLEGTK